MIVIGDGKKCEDICKHAPPEKGKWPCEDCDIRYHDRAEGVDIKDDNMIHTKCLRCGKHAVSVLDGLTGLPYTNYSYCKDCLREGLKLLKKQDEETIECYACGHRLQKDWVWCPWCKWEIAKKNKI